MSEKFYKIGNTWYPWQTAHGLYGYTKTPTIRITYISTSQATWGQPESGYGFFDGDASEPQDGSYFHTSTWGWFDADTMAKTIWLMPSECEIDDIFFENDGDISPGARLIIDPNVSIDEEDWRYLIASVRNLGWHTLDEWEELGWVLSDPNTLYFGGDFSGNNIRMESVDGGGGLIEKYASYKSLCELRGWEPGGLFIDKPRMMGICGVLTETSDSVTLIEVPKQLSVGRIEFTGSLAEGGIPEGGVVEEYIPAPTNYIDIVLGLRWDVDNGGWLAKSFAVNDWWWSGILSQSDLSRLQAFGCDYCQTTNTSTAYPGLIGAVKYDDGFYYDLLELYDEIGDQPAPIASGFYFAERTSTADRDYTGCLVIYARHGYTRPIKSYKVRITKKEEYIDVILGFRWDTSLNDWRSINFDYALEDNNWWGCFISSDDATKISRYGVEVGSAGWLGDNGGLLYSDDFTFEVLEVYSELDHPVTGYDLSTFDIRSVSNSASTHMLSIFNTQRDATMLKFWKCRITRKPAPVDYIDVLCGFKYRDGNWGAVTFPGPGYEWWAGIIYANDQAKLQELGLISDTSYPHDEILYSNAYSYECVAMYSDMGVTSVQFDPSNFYVDKSTSDPAISIFSRAAFSTPVKTWVCRITRKPATTYTNPVTNSVYAKWRGNATSDPNYKNYFSDINGSSIGPYYSYATYMNKFYLNIPDDDYVSDTITGVTVGTRYFARASSSSSIGSSTQGILILNKDSGGWYVILSFYSSDISDGNYALDGTITLLKST